MRVPRISYARSADGVRLAFTTTGHGPALVFVPWVPFSNFLMEWQSTVLSSSFERLARRLTVIHYDGRGTGHSQRDVTDLSLEAMVADLLAVVDQVGAAEVNLLGQYNSCPHAIAFAARYPERVNRMALFGGSARGWNAMSASQTQALLSLIEQDWDTFADTAAHLWMGWSAGEAGRAVADGSGGRSRRRSPVPRCGQPARPTSPICYGGSRADPGPAPAGHDPDPGRRPRSLAMTCRAGG